MVDTVDWNLIVEDLGPKLYRYFNGRFNSTLADDLTQETLVRLVAKHQAGEFDVTRGTILSYAFGIARFVRLENQKKNRSDHTVFDGELESIQDDLDLSQSYEDREEFAQLRKEIAFLPEPQQEILLLMIDKEFTMEKISTHLDIPTGTVKSHIHRAKKTLYNKLSNILGGPYGRQI